MVVGELTAELSAKLARRLALEWEDINWQLFGSRMRRPILELVEGQVRLGEWRKDDRRLALSKMAVLTRPWAEILEVLKHEMAHQFVDEVLGGEDRPHGPAFRRVCRERGIDAAASGPVRGGAEPTHAEDRIIERVRKLLALAESSNRHEAELAASTAQRMMLKYNIDVQRRMDGGTEGELGHLWLGKPTGRVQAHQRKLGVLLTEHFFVEAIWIQVYRPLEGKAGSVLELCGRPENLQMAEFVHDFVSRTIERLWKEHKTAHGLRSNRNRRTFLAGAVDGFTAKLRDKQASAQQEGLIWTGDRVVRDYLRRRHPKISTASYSASYDQAAYAQGHSAGRGIVLSRPVSSSATDGRPRALPRGSG